MSSQLQNKLLHYEVKPPAEVWSKIAASLDENVIPSLSEKLYQYEEVPSPQIWNKIETQLEDTPKEKNKVVPFYIRYSRPLKYSGTVAAMIVVAVSVSLLVSKRTGSESTTQNVTANKIHPDTTTFDNNSRKEISETVSRSLERNGNGTSFSKTRTSRTKRVYYQSSFSLGQHFLPGLVERGPAIDASTIPDDKYMIYSDGNGNAVRLPKKIYNAVACPTENDDCKRRLKELKEKFVSAAITSDFNGILEILRSLQENQ